MRGMLPAHSNVIVHKEEAMIDPQCSFDDSISSFPVFLGDVDETTTSKTNLAGLVVEIVAMPKTLSLDDKVASKQITVTPEDSVSKDAMDDVKSTSTEEIVAGHLPVETSSPVGVQEELLEETKNCDHGATEDVDFEPETVPETDSALLDLDMLMDKAMEAANEEYAGNGNNQVACDNLKDAESVPVTAETADDDESNAVSRCTSTSVDATREIVVPDTETSQLGAIESGSGEGADETCHSVGLDDPQAKDEHERSLQGKDGDEMEEQPVPDLASVADCEAVVSEVSNLHSMEAVSATETLDPSSNQDPVTNDECEELLQDDTTIQNSPLASGMESEVIGPAENSTCPSLQERCATTNAAKPVGDVDLIQKVGVSKKATDDEPPAQLVDGEQDKAANDLLVPKTEPSDIQAVEAPLEDTATELVQRDELEEPDEGKAVSPSVDVVDVDQAMIDAELSEKENPSPGNEATSDDVIGSLETMAAEAEAELDALLGGDDLDSSSAKESLTPSHSQAHKTAAVVVTPKPPDTKKEKKAKTRLSIPHRTPPIRQWTEPKLAKILPAKEEIVICASTIDAEPTTPPRKMRVPINKNFRPTVFKPFRLRTEERFWARNCTCCAHKRKSPTSVLSSNPSSPIKPTRLTKKY